MKSNPLTSILLGVLALSAVASVVCCYFFVSDTREKGSLNGVIMNFRIREPALNALVGDCLEYSKKNPAIDPLLESIGAKPKSTPAAPQKPGGK